MVDESIEMNFSDMEDMATQETEIVNLIDEQVEILKQIFNFGLMTQDDDDPNIEVGDHQIVPRALFTFKAIVYD